MPYKTLPGLILRAVLVLVLAAVAVAQDQSAAAAAPVNQGTLPLLFVGEAPRKNLVSLGFTISSYYDDNPLSSNPPKSAVVSTLASRFALNVDRTRWSVNLQYDPQYSYSSDINYYNSAAHVANAAVEFRPDSRWTVALRNAYSHTSNPVQIISSTAVTPVFGVTDQMNQTGYGDYLAITTEQAGTDISYALSAHSSIGVGGGYNSLQSSQPGTLNPYYRQDVTEWSGHAFYSHRVTAHQTLGLQFQWSRIDASAGASLATPMSLQYFHQIQLARGFSFSLFGGPELTNTRDDLSLALALQGIRVPAGTSLIIRDRLWAGSGGGTLNWTTHHNAAWVSFTRRTTNGGPYGGIVQASMANANYRRQLTPNSALNLSAAYTDNGQVDPLSLVPVGSYFFTRAQYIRELGSRAEFSLSYARFQAESVAPGYLPLTGNHNEVLVSLSYHFERALGK